VLGLRVRGGGRTQVTPVIKMGEPSGPPEKTRFRFKAHSRGTSIPGPARQRWGKPSAGTRRHVGKEKKLDLTGPPTSGKTFPPFSQGGDAPPPPRVFFTHPNRRACPGRGPLGRGFCVKTCTKNNCSSILRRGKCRRFQPVLAAALSGAQKKIMQPFSRDPLRGVPATLARLQSRFGGGPPRPAHRPFPPGSVSIDATPGSGESRRPRVPPPPPPPGDRPSRGNDSVEKTPRGSML